MLMKHLVLIFSLLIFCGSGFAQAHKLVVYGMKGEKCSDTIKVGDYVKVKLKNGKKITGYIPNIENDYFIVEYDTVRPEQVVALRYEPRHPEHVGKIIMISAGAIAVLGIGTVIASGSINSEDGLGVLLVGVLVSIASVPILIVGIVTNAAEKTIGRSIGQHWGLKIV